MRFLLQAWLLALLVTQHITTGQAAQMQVGFAKADITPSRPLPMWGYAARHAALSTGTRDMLWARAAVIDVGTDKVAIVGLDLGRAPTQAMMTRIRAAVAQQAGVNLVLICGSHTHHGPVIELLDEPGKGKGEFDDAVAYTKELERKLIETIVTAASQVQPAKIGWASKNVLLNRNRHTRLEPKPIDTQLAVIRLDDLNDQPLGVIVNYAAHATMLDSADLRFSGDWPGQMTRAVEEQLKTNCIFVQGAAGDLSPAAPADAKSIESFGQLVAQEVVAVHNTIAPQAVRRGRIDARQETFDYPARMKLNNAATVELFGQAFFPELAQAMLTDELKHDRVRPQLTTILINRRLALVGVSGEFFCEHALRLKERSRADMTLLLGYCNDHHMYFPTIQAAAEGGYGADSLVSWVALGAGEEMMNRALIAIYTMLGNL